VKRTTKKQVGNACGTSSLGFSDIKSSYLNKAFSRVRTNVFMAFFCRGCFLFTKHHTCIQMVFFSFLPPVWLKHKKMIDVSGYNTSLPPDGMVVKFFEDCCLESNPFSKEEEKKSCICLGKFIMLHILCSYGKGRKGCRYSRVSWGWEYITSPYSTAYIWQCL